MCGIFAIIHYGECPAINIDLGEIKKNFLKCSTRGPEKSTFEYYEKEQVVLGFHRLAINGFNNEASGQPLEKDGCTLICNGEIYNWKQLATASKTSCPTGSDCEVIINIYRKYGIARTLQMIDGVFAFLLWDHEKGEMYIARDPYGVRPLFIWTTDKPGVSPIVIASEVKIGMNIVPYEPKTFHPGTYMWVTATGSTVRSYHTICSTPKLHIKNVGDTAAMIRDALVKAVRKRVDNTDREIACLLSGGLDSSLITALVAREYTQRYGPTGAKKLHTWSIGMNGSEDLMYARKVATFLGTTHHEIKLTEKEFLEVIPEVIYAIESNDTTTVRASVGNWLVCKHIKAGCDAKVIFNGDGSDEVTGGYLYFHYAPSPSAFDKECRRLLEDIHYFDVLRSDRSISSHGLEPRTPFLDKNFVETYLSIPANLRDHSNNKKCEKYLLRNAFDTLDILPRDVLWRTKEAFSDGVSKHTRSWFEIIQEFARDMTGVSDMACAEQLYYDHIFHEIYGSKKHTRHIMPYKWMPSFIDAKDASARTLGVYQQTIDFELPDLGPPPSNLEEPPPRGGEGVEADSVIGSL